MYAETQSLSSTKLFRCETVLNLVMLVCPCVDWMFCLLIAKVKLTYNYNTLLKVYYACKIHIIEHLLWEGIIKNNF